MKYCERCTEVIREGEPFRKYENPGASHGGATVYMHAYDCKRAPQQVAPAGRW
ncbi:hypothetical protein [Streptomyces sp. NPDC003299]